MVAKMRKIFGKVIIIFVSLIAFVVHPRISLEIRTENGQQNQVVVGQPFILDVVIDDVYGSVSLPKIKGLDKFVSRQSGSYMSSVNGKATARYSYQVNIDTIGSYVLGPAVITHQQQELVSNEVCVNVVKDVGAAINGNKNNQSGAKTFLRLMVDSESVVVGQRVGCILRFYYQDPSLSLHNVSMPELPDFDIKEIGKSENGMAEIDGVSYKYVQWQWDMYPKKPGEFIVPAYNADYDIPSKDNNNFLGGFFTFINSRVDRKRIYSNALTIKVLPLPYSDRPVHAVGVFDHISADIKPCVAKVGEGMLLTIEIEGIGNLDAIAVPILKMPASLKYYDSHSAIIAPQHNDELPKKRFEFVVQGMQSGNCEIPEQLFTYFDIERNRYVTLRTSSLALSIMPGINNNVKMDIVEPTQRVEQDVIVQEEKIAHINTVGQWYPMKDSVSLPWWVFNLLFLFPCIYFGYPFVVERYITLIGSNKRLARRWAFKNARKKIKMAKRIQQDKHLYGIFVELFQELERIYGVSSVEAFKAQYNEWNDFFERITYAAYAQSHDNDTDELCRMAQQWIERLEKII
jgi:BatD DUF11 like domain